MFEHFGIMDIWSGFKKYKTVMLTLIAGFTIFFTIVFLVNSKKTMSTREINEDIIYISSASYYVEPVNEVLGMSDSALYKSIPDNYVAMMDTDFCRKYVFDKLTAVYSKQFIVENSGLNKDGGNINPENMDIDSMKELYLVKKYTGSMMVEISSMTYNKELSESVKDICKEFLTLNVDDKIKNSSIRFGGEASRFIKTSDLGSETVEKTDTRYIVKAPTVTQVTFKTVIKKIFIPVFLIVILCIGFIMIMGLVNPTLNRISDFSDYDVPVIGEIKDYNKMKGLK